MFAFPALVADIGGTNIRLALAERPGGPLIGPVLANTRDSPDIAAALAQAAARLPLKPRTALICGAGPLRGRDLQLTHGLRQYLSGAALAQALDVEQGLLLNDFEALALSLPALTPKDLRPIGQAGTQAGTKIVLGPGTGLGVAALISTDGRWRALPSEAGHIAFAPADAREAALWPLLAVDGRVSAERLLSGQGLSRLFGARTGTLDAPEAAAVVERAQADPAGAEAQAIRCFWRLIARFSGDIALAFLARGGVYLAGGVLPRLTDFLDEAEFRTNFEAKAPHQALMREISCALIVAPEPALAGLAALAAAPARYAIDFAERCWRPPVSGL